MDQKKTGTVKGLVVLAVFFCLLPSVEAAQVPPGRPFQELLDLIDNLQNSVNNLQNGANDLQDRVTELERTEPLTFALDCAVHSINDSLKFLKPGDTLLVSGVCNENVMIREEIQRITLDGQGSATINGPDPTAPTVHIRGQGITIKGFTVRGGETGILVTRGGTALIDGNTIQSTGSNGILVNQSSSARIINNTIRNNPGSGILVNENSSARIGFLNTDEIVASPNIIQSNGNHGIIVTRSSNAGIVGNTINNNAGAGVELARASQAEIVLNTIQNNAENGILVNENSSVRIGILRGEDTVASPNIINMNGENGILVTRSSNARIVGNTISNNTDGSGIVVTRVSHAEISSNTINGNSEHGIFVTQNSGVNLGRDDGTTIFDLPNNTTFNNTLNGIRCLLNSYADGRLGTLNGASGAKNFLSAPPGANSGGCHDSLLP